MTVDMDPKYKQMLDDVFDAFTMLSGGNIANVMHVQGDTTRWSPSAVELFGLSGEYIRNGSMDWNDYVHPEDRKRYMDVMTPLVTGERQTYDLNYRVRTKEGTYVNFRVMGAVLRDAEGSPSLIGGVMINQGLTENTDPVTVLRNKNGYYEDLTELMKADKKTVTLLVGISKLSEINQVYGYTYGNRVLQEIAWLLQETVKERGTVYRMDGATFAILTDKVSREEVAAIYDTVRIKLQRGIRVDGVRNILVANGGLISTQDAGADAATIHSCLNYAYRESKQRKHGELVDFNGSINYEDQGTLEVLSTIRDSILDDCRGFLLEYQPIVSAHRERLLGVEACVKWQDERYGNIGAPAFIPVLERDFVFEELGDWILHQALTDGVKFVEKDTQFVLAVNISPVQMEDDYFVDSVLQALHETGFPARNLCLKLTKDCRLLDVERSSMVIGQLHSHQIRVIIDDFGSGVDSIGFLKKMSADVICFDSELVEGIEHNEQDRELLEYLARMVKARGTHVNIKGVNTEELSKVLRQLSISSMQGDYYAGPISFEQMMEKYFS
ncbi:MAG: EAL domain-containing protein [Lachnospiraceae bacterium]|nr:EAL domain-containing protein [Lachnospiraceae bacterium]